MTTPTAKQTKPKGNLFDEDITSLYQLDLPPPRNNEFELQVEVMDEEEQYMLDAFHEQQVAAKGRSAIAQVITTEFGEMATHASYVITGTAEQINRHETAAQTGRLEKQVQNGNSYLFDQIGRHIYQVHEIAARSIYEDIRRPIYKPYQPERAKRKGLVRSAVAFLFGEK